MRKREVFLLYCAKSEDFDHQKMIDYKYSSIISIYISINRETMSGKRTYDDCDSNGEYPPVLCVLLAAKSIVCLSTDCRLSHHLLS